MSIENWKQRRMKRRFILSGSAAASLLLAGCVQNINVPPDASNPDENGDTGRDVPVFEVDESAPGEFILLRHQPQTSTTIRAGDECEIAVVLGNAGGENVHGEVALTLESPTGRKTRKTIIVSSTESLPSGTAQCYDMGPITFDTDGEWSLTATTGVAHVHPEYDETIFVETCES